MIGFKEYLSESRMAPLYHATSPHIAEEILKSNKFKASLSHPFPGMKKYKDSKTHSYSPQYTKGTSFSRSKQAAINFGFHDKGLNAVVVFEVDQQKLLERNKVIPVSYIGSSHSGDRFLNVARTPRDNIYIPAEKSNVYANEYEEYVLGDIKNIEKMIIKIHVMSPLTEEIIALKFPKLWHHSKLFNSTSKYEKGNFYDN